MSRLDSSDITWIVAASARAALDELRDTLGPKWYDDTKHALREVVTDFINAHGACDQRQGSSVACIGSTDEGHKVLKVRCALMGAGKSGGLRVALSADCVARRIGVVLVERRRESPSVEEMRASAQTYSAQQLRTQQR